MIFLILQILLALFVLLSFSTPDSVEAGDSITQFVFGFFSIAVLIVQPMRGISAVSSETMGKTIDLMVLTRLSSWRILLGKWASIVTQSALLLATVIPYLVIRYFFGGMQLFAELSLLAAIFLLSAALTATFVGFSANKSVILRGLLFILFGLSAVSTLIGIFFNGGFEDLLDIFSASSGEELLAALGFLTLCLYTGYYMLEIGASRIATLAESTALRKRLIGLAMICASVLLFLYLDIRYVGLFPAYVVSLIITGMIAIDCFTEEPPQISRVVEKLATKGFLGRSLGYLFYRGWHTGFLLILVLFLLLWGIVILSKDDINWADNDTKELWIFHVGSFYSVLLPLLLVQLFQTKIKERFIAYMAFLIGGIMISILVSTMTTFLPSKGVFLAGSFLPGMYIGIVDVNSTHEIGSTLMTCYLLFTVCCLFIYFLKEYKKTRLLEAQCLNHTPDETV